MPPRRLQPVDPGAARPPRVRFRWEGRTVEGVPGEPVAVALLAAGVRTLSRSFRFHRPRGLMCSTGQCGWCECAVDGRPSVRTCQVPVRAGLDVRGEHAWPRVGADVFELLGLGSRFVPPTFYHHRFLRPKALRKRYLDVIRRFGGRGRLRPGPRPPAALRTLRREETGVLVVGAGRAGLLAAIAAAGAGARVVVLEAREAGADGALMTAAERAGVEVWAGTTATGRYDDQVTALGPATAWELRPRALIAAMGSYERIPTVPGADLPGVIGARLVRELIERHRVLPGERAVCVGDGPELEAARVALVGAGARVEARIPTAALVRIGGRRGVAWVEHRDEGDARRRLIADLVVLGDRTPNLDLLLAAGGTVGWREDGRLAPVVGAGGRTSVAGLFVATMDDGEEACGGVGVAAAEYAAGGRADPDHSGGNEAVDRGPAGDERPGRPGDPSRPAATPAPPQGHIHDGAVLCFCEDVRAWEIRAEQRAGYGDPELVKRRTGALTGPCQGKYCLTAVTCLLAEPASTDPRAPAGDDLDLPTARPPLVPTRLADLAVHPVDDPVAAEP